MKEDKLLKLVKDRIQKYTLSNNYWMVRSEGTKFYSDFKKNSYVGIGYNNIPIIKLKNEKDLELIKKDLLENINIHYKESKRPKYILNQIVTFDYEIKENDYIIVPNSRIGKILIGKCVSNDLSAELERVNGKYNKSDYIRIRKVEWIKEISRNKVNPNLLYLFFTHNALTNANNYKEYINNFLFDAFSTKDSTNLVVKITKEEDIDANGFFKLADILSLADEIGESLNLNFSSKDLSIKIVIQSKGNFVLFSKSKRDEVILGLFLLSTFLTSCSDNSINKLSDEEIKIVEEVSTKYDKLDQKLKKVKISIGMNQ